MYSFHGLPLSLSALTEGTSIIDSGVGGYQILPSDSAQLSDLPSSLVTGMYTVFSCTVCRALVTFPHAFTTVSGVVEVLERVDSLKVCPGNADEKFSSLRSFRKGMFSAGIPYYI